MVIGTLARSDDDPPDPVPMTQTPTLTVADGTDCITSTPSTGQSMVMAISMVTNSGQGTETTKVRQCFLTGDGEASKLKIDRYVVRGRPTWTSARRRCSKFRAGR